MLLASASSFNSLKSIYFVLRANKKFALLLRAFSSANILNFSALSASLCEAFFIIQFIVVMVQIQ